MAKGNQAVGNEGESGALADGAPSEACQFFGNAKVVGSGLTPLVRALARSAARSQFAVKTDEPLDHDKDRSRINNAHTVENNEVD